MLENDASPCLGGSYQSVREDNNGGEVHHIPAYAAYSGIVPLSRDEGPAIWMESIDHHQTASWGRSRDAKLYRQQQKQLIEQGCFQEAQQMDIDDIHIKFGSHYDAGIGQAKTYTDAISYRLTPTPRSTYDNS